MEASAMTPRSYDTVRVNIQLPLVLKEKIEEYARSSQESVSEFFRKSAKARVVELRRRERERGLAAAYDAMTDERAETTDDWEPLDLEGWE